MLEYTILILIILAAFLTMQTYIKRGISGRWKSSVDDMGEQYDPRLSSYSLRQTMESNAFTRISTVPSTNGTNGFFTMRTDQSNSYETKNGQSNIGY